MAVMSAEHTPPAVSLPTDRRRIGAIALAVVGLFSLLRLRGSCEPMLNLIVELAIQLTILGSWLLKYRRPTSASMRGAWDYRLFYVGVAMALLPWCLQFALRSLGQGTGLELIAMSSFAWATLLGAVCAQRRRSLGTSVVCSGFLTLLATCSSDHSIALLLALLWGGLCLWWLASSQWERAQRCQASAVVENRLHRPLVVLVGCGVFILSAWSVAGRFPPAGRLPWEIAPTSGGTSSNDAFARSGVGDGDALVAARENAASFGAVDSDLLLDSKEASLFDLYSDTFGEPVRKQEVERTVALAPEQPDIAQPNNMASSDGASSALTTQRRSAARQTPMASHASDALMFWIGRPDVHLALERFSYFDGVEWKSAPPDSESASASVQSRPLQPLPFGNRTWFSVHDDQTASNIRSLPFQGNLAEAVKFARLKSPRIPTTAGMHSWHIQQVDDASFFQVDANDNLSMPGRKSVPEFTIVRYVNREMDLQSIVQSVVRSPHPLPYQPADLEPSTTSSSSQGEQRARALAREIVSDQAGKISGPSWNIVTRLLERLRQEYRLDRTLDTSDSDDPLADFLDRRAGSDLMFATAAAIMLRELGYETRLVTGFLVRGENRLGWTKELAVYAQDTHAWLELKVGPASWIPIEPTPGYPLPVYHISWQYWLILNATRILMVLSFTLCIFSLAYWRRVILFDWICRATAFAWWLGDDRQRCRWLLTILDWRSHLVGHRRPAHVSPGRWYAMLASADDSSVSQSTKVFFGEADRLWFGNQGNMSQAGRQAGFMLWTKTNCRLMRSVLNSSQCSSHP